MPDSITPSRASRESNVLVVVSVVTPSCSEKIRVTSPVPGKPSTSNVWTRRSGGTISW
jgi:hypothetical protein